jgi:hypothetical protein
MMYLTAHPGHILFIFYRYDVPNGTPGHILFIFYRYDVPNGTFLLPPAYCLLLLPTAYS